MSLDITAYSNLLPLGHRVQDCENYDHVRVYAYDSFPASFRGVPVLGAFTGWGGSTTFLDGGCYETTDKTETHRFRAGSYTGYNWWRLDLARQFNPAALSLEGGEPSLTQPDPDKPFYELIWFADNEGSIGSEAASDLLADFEEHADRHAPAGQVDYARGKYQDWTRACQLAAVGGVIYFH